MLASALEGQNTEGNREEDYDYIQCVVHHNQN